ncbi:MAG: hypothetical protein HRU35_07635 [Rickettsiaceae bacterium]|nr:hypothetical protein [Rickettsiaceae bacterium]
MSKEIAQFKHQITKATLGDGTVLGATTIKIFAPDNKLQDGYYVYIENIDDNRVPDGVYYVNNVTENNFDIFIFEHPWNFPALGITVLDLDLNSCWHKIPSKKHETYKNCTISTHFGDNQANIDLQVLPMCLDRSSIVFIDNIGYRISQSGTVVKVPNGYYSVRSVSFGGQKLVVDLSEMSTMMRSDMVYPQGVNDVISVTKIGQDDQGIFSRINNDVMVTIIFSPSLPLPGGFVYKNIVRLFDYNHDCKVGDYSVFQGLPKDGLNVDGIIVQNNSRYKIFELGKYYTDLLAEDDPWQVDCLIIGYLKEGLKITATSIYTDIVHIIIDFYYTLIEGTSITGDGITGMIKLSNIPDLSNFHVQYISYTDNNPIIIPKIIEGFKHTITKVTFGDGTIKGKWTFNIYAPNNGLQNGNYVYIKNDSQFNYAIPTNVYYVYNTSKDNFSIFLISNDYTIMHNVYPGTWEFDLKGEGCWHKIPAREYETIKGAIISGHMGVQQLSIDSQEYLNWQPKNVVFVAGIGYRRINDNTEITVKVCDGYYNIENIAGFGRININIEPAEYSSAT